VKLKERFNVILMFFVLFLHKGAKKNICHLGTIKTKLWEKGFGFKEFAYKVT